MSINELINRYRDFKVVFTVSERAWPSYSTSARRLRTVYSSPDQAFRGAKIKSFANDGKVFSVLAVKANAKIDRLAAID